MTDIEEHIARSISVHLRGARKAQGLTQSQVAEKIGRSSEFYARIERGNALPGLATLVLIAKVLRLRADCMLGLDDLTGGAAPAAPTPVAPSAPPEC